MSELFFYIRQLSDTLGSNYNIDLNIFLIIYLISFIPFYLGYFIIVYGSTRNLKMVDIFSLNFKGKFRWNTQVEVGLIVHVIGRLMPYVYIVVYGINIPTWIYILITISILISMVPVVRKISSGRGLLNDNHIGVTRSSVVNDESEIQSLWFIYNSTFEPVNKISPCKQSLDEDHFIQALRNPTVEKYILHKDGIGIIGVALITNDFINTPWISEDYFVSNFKDKYDRGLIYYFMGIAISDEFRGNRYSIFLLEKIIEDLPIDAIVGFDHSKNVNPYLHHFTKVIKQSGEVKRIHIDRQHYHVVHRNK